MFATPRQSRPVTTISEKAGLHHAARRAAVG
jgi:hypothetical protein